MLLWWWQGHTGFDGLFALGRVNLLMSAFLFLDFPFSWGLFWISLRGQAPL